LNKIATVTLQRGGKAVQKEGKPEDLPFQNNSFLLSGRKAERFKEASFYFYLFSESSHLKNLK
jgi:hypothetical protein